jgi:hypothetical protein
LGHCDPVGAIGPIRPVELGLLGIRFGCKRAALADRRGQLRLWSRGGASIWHPPGRERPAERGRTQCLGLRAPTAHVSEVLSPESHAWWTSDLRAARCGSVAQTRAPVVGRPDDRSARAPGVILAPGSALPLIAGTLQNNGTTYSNNWGWWSGRTGWPSPPSCWSTSS